MRAPLWITAILALTLSMDGRADSFDEALIRHAPRILKELQDRGIHSVGVLPFRYQKANGKSTFHAGTINRSAATRVENALIMFIDEKEPTPVILHSVTTSAEKQVGDWAGKINARRKLFQIDFDPAWDAPPMKAKAFLTGLVHLGANPSETTIRIELMTEESLTRSSDTMQFLQKITEFSVITDRDLLREIGESFVISGRSIRDEQLRNPSGKPDLNRIAVRSMQRRDSGLDLFDEDEMPELDLDLDSNEPVTVEGGLPENFLGLKVQIFFDGELQPILREKGRAGSEEYFVASPKDGQKVEVKVQHTGAKDSSPIIPFVLSINGESTWQQEMGDPLGLRKWLLYHPNHPENTPNNQYGSMSFDGFMVSDTESVPWKILTDEESEKQVASFGGKAGTIQLAVFQPEAVVQDDLRISTYGLKSRSLVKKVSLSELRQKLRESSRRDWSAKSLGLIVLDDAALRRKEEVQLIETKGYMFRGNLVIRYYSPKTADTLDLKDRDE